MPSCAPDPITEQWTLLESHRDRLSEAHVSELFDADVTRLECMSVDACGIHLDFSKQRLDLAALQSLLELGARVQVEAWRDRMFAGEVVNITEDRRALHVALRWPRDGLPPAHGSSDIHQAVHQVLDEMGAFADRIQQGLHRGWRGEAIRDVVNIGIGGSDLGPAMVYFALTDQAPEGAPRAHYVSNLDATGLNRVLDPLDPATTLFIVASKTFTTRETLALAQTARAWLVNGLGDEAAVSRHFAAVTANVDAAGEFGIPAQHVFGFWDWVGGRYSLWSAVGLSLLCSLGRTMFHALLAGAHAMDRHFQTAPLNANLPMLLGLIGIWNRNLLAIPSHAVLPYDYALALLPAHLQQLEMESNGKRVTREGAACPRHSVPVVWGSLGNNAQHAYYQMLHQGTEMVAADIIVAAHCQRSAPGHDEAVIANALAQSEALMRGRRGEAVRDELEGQGVESSMLDAALAHRAMPGNRPNSVIVYERLTPQILGALVALYEHKVFVQAMCWGTNPFDQFGVELGKQLAVELEQVLTASSSPLGHDPSTCALVARIQQLRQKSCPSES